MLRPKKKFRAKTYPTGLSYNYEKIRYIFSLSLFHLNEGCDRTIVNVNKQHYNHFLCNWTFRRSEKFVLQSEFKFVLKEIIFFYVLFCFALALMSSRWLVEIRFLCSWTYTLYVDFGMCMKDVRSHLCTINTFCGDELKIINFTTVECIILHWPYINMCNNVLTGI